MVFPLEAVNRIDVFMSAEQWRSVQNHLTQLWGIAFGGGGPRECARRHRVGRYVEAWRAASASTVAR